MAELADAPDLGSGGTPVQVQVLSPAPADSVGTQSSGGDSKIPNLITRCWGSDLSLLTAPKKQSILAMLCFFDLVMWRRTWSRGSPSYPLLLRFCRVRNSPFCVSKYRYSLGKVNFKRSPLFSSRKRIGYKSCRPHQKRPSLRN